MARAQAELTTYRGTTRGFIRVGPEGTNPLRKFFIAHCTLDTLTKIQEREGVIAKLN